MSGIITAAAIAAAGTMYAAHEQSKAQKRASNQQRAAADRTNKLQAEANNRAEQENNRAAKADVRNYEVEGKGDNGGIYNSNGALGINPSNMNLGSNNKLGSGDDFSLY